MNRSGWKRMVTLNGIWEIEYIHCEFYALFAGLQFMVDVECFIDFEQFSCLRLNWMTIGVIGGGLLLYAGNTFYHRLVIYLGNVFDSIGNRDLNYDKPYWCVSIWQLNVTRISHSFESRYQIRLLNNVGKHSSVDWADLISHRPTKWFIYIFQNGI